MPQSQWRCPSANASYRRCAFAVDYVRTSSNVRFWDRPQRLHTFARDGPPSTSARITRAQKGSSHCGCGRLCNNTWRRSLGAFGASVSSPHCFFLSSTTAVDGVLRPSTAVTCVFSAVHTSNNVEATFDIVAKTATMSNEFCVKISSFRQSRTLLRQCCFDIVASVNRALRLLRALRPQWER